MKSITFDAASSQYKRLHETSNAFDMSRFEVAKQEQHEFEHYIDLTAKLIKRPYFQTFKMLEKWPLEKIIRHYELCTKHAGDMPGDVKWWWLRKKEKQN